MFRRSRENLAGWFTVSMGSILILCAGLLYILEAQKQRRAFDQRLYDICQFMAASVEDGSYQDRQRVDLENVPILGEEALPLETTFVYARWYSPEAELIQFYGVIPPEKLVGSAGFETIATGLMERARLRQLTLPVFEGDVLIGYLQVAAPLAPVETALQQLQTGLMIGVPLALGAIAIAGWVLGGLAMQPIRQSYLQLQQFTADASHELRTPLAAIINHAQVGLMDLNNPDEQQLRLEKIIHRAEAMGKLVGDLLLLARNEGQLPPNALQRVDLINLLKALVPDYHHQAQQQGVHLMEDWPDHPLTIKAQPDLLQRAIANVLSNAIQYTPTGGTIQLRVWQQTRLAVIQVEDSGIGIASENLPHIFERFYRVDKARSRRTGGFGLGLAIVEQIIQVHDGQIRVSSQLAQGTTFQIELPLS